MTYLREALPRVQVDIIDEQVLGRRRFIDALSRSGYDIAGFSPISLTYGRNLECARILKKNGAIVVMGGHYAPALSKEILANRGPGSGDYCVDAIVRYDGEHALRELAKGTPFSGINNLVYRREDGSIAENPVEMLKFSDLPPVDYTLVNLEEYFRRQPPDLRILPFISQRGCQWAEKSGRCLFCSIPARSFTAMDPSAVGRQTSFLAEKLGVRHLFEASTDFASSAEWLSALAAGSAGLKKLSWRIFARAESLTRANIRYLKAVNVGHVCIGTESFSDEILRRMGKGSNCRVNKTAISLLVEAGIVPRISLTLGSLGESRESLKQTFVELKKLDLTAEGWEIMLVNPLTPRPGTVAWSRLLAKERKYRGQDIFNTKELRFDWLKHFCEVDYPRLAAARNEINNLIASRI